MGAPEPAKTQMKSGWKVVLVVLAILFALGAALAAVILGTVASGVSAGMDKAKVDTTRNSMQSVEGALRLYFARFEKFPDERQGLQAVVSAKFLEEIPKDAWGQPIAYRPEGTGFVLRSLGSDGAPGGEGSAADLERRYTPKAK
jgi:general secretion pathway protein G